MSSADLQGRHIRSAEADNGTRSRQAPVLMDSCHWDIIDGNTVEDDDSRALWST